MTPDLKDESKDLNSLQGLSSIFSTGLLPIPQQLNASQG